MPVSHVAKADLAYAKGHPILTDAEYDRLVEHLKLREPRPTDVAHGRTTKLPAWMGSLDKAGPPSVSSRVEGDAEYTASDKLDGVSCLYHGPTGRLLTRGDGATGQDVTRLLHPAIGVPQNMPGVTVRGELVISVTDFESRFAGEFANARNLVAGCVNAKKPRAEVLAALRFVAYELIKPAGRLPAQQLVELRARGFVVVHSQPCDPTPAALTSLLMERKVASSYDLDGLVITKETKYKNVTSGNPTHAFAYKDPSLQDAADVAVRAVTWTASRHARLVPVLEFEPVVLAGAKVSRATGHNYEFVRNAGIGVGAVVQIVRSGDVIPKIVRVVRRAASPAEPLGAYKVVGVHAIADGQHDAARLAHFLSTLDVRGAGPATSSKLAEAGHILPGSVATLAPNEAAAIAGTVSAASIPADLSAAVSRTPLWRLLAATGSFGPGVGETALRALSSEFPLHGLRDVTQESAENVPGVGPVTARRVVDGLQEAYAYLNGLELPRALDVAAATHAEEPFAGVTVCFSGVRDPDAELRIFAAGGDVTSSGAASTLLVVRKLPPPDTAKSRAAIAAGAEVLTLQQLRDRLQ
jgi:NAD-dependent DNA ligase